MMQKLPTTITLVISIWLTLLSVLSTNKSWAITQKSQQGATTSLITSQSLRNNSNQLARRASWQAKLTQVKPQEFPFIGRKITSITANSPLAKAGLKVDDIVLSVNQTRITSPEVWYDISDALVANKNYQLRYQRKLQVFEVTVKFTNVKKESYAHLDTYYQAIANPYGLSQRVIITKPKNANANKPSPAIFMVQGLSCSSIEVTPGRGSNYSRLIKELVSNSNMVMLRVEKPGVGDSEGNCSTTDFKTELAGYETALQYLKTLPYVDSDKILIYGSSMGSALAPYLANKYKANAVIADGTFFRSWFEHMLEIERRIKAMQGRTEAEISQQMNQAYIPLYYGMLIEKKSYQQLITEQPLLAKYNYHGAEHMYGRPMSYYHQVQDFDFAGQWQQLEVPVRIRWGTNDWIMSEADNDMIVTALKAQGHNNVELYKYPGLDHWETVHKSASDSFHGKKGQWQDKISQQLIDWANELNR